MKSNLKTQSIQLPLPFLDTNTENGNPSKRKRVPDKSTELKKNTHEVKNGYQEEPKTNPNLFNWKEEG